MEKEVKKKEKHTPFPPLYWLVVIFEFFERGSYYGMMSVFSVYLTDQLHFAKQDVGVIKSTIQPLLYFLPIISGALADRFGYRRTLLVAFSLLGTGYFLTAQATEYNMIFLALVVMGLGAGTFKPVISGSIARCTDETNSTLGFGIFYWSINLGAFLVPLFIVPFLKNNFGWDWVILAAAIGTGTMVLPTLLLFKEPPAPAEASDQKKASLLQTLANAFEIIYSPVVLLHGWAHQSSTRKTLLLLLLVGILGGGVWHFSKIPVVSLNISAPIHQAGRLTLVLRSDRNLSKAPPFTLVGENAAGEQLLLSQKHAASEAYQPVPTEIPAGARVGILLHDPDRLQASAPALLQQIRRLPGCAGFTEGTLFALKQGLNQRTTLYLTHGFDADGSYNIQQQGPSRVLLQINDERQAEALEAQLVPHLRTFPGLAGISEDEVRSLSDKANERPFLLLFIGLLLSAALIILRLEPLFKVATSWGRTIIMMVSLGALWGVIIVFPHLSLFARILCGVILTTPLSLYAIDFQDHTKFKDHFRFLSMIFIYSGFWVLYFQMFDSVLWYVQAYVDATSLNNAVNSFLSALGVIKPWRFDIEHVTVINAGTIILLQLLISKIVKNTKALPTMIAGICMGTLGMGILAISSGIWVFIMGITIFSIGEMTAHPKFIAYVGQTAPKTRVAMYMGYLFLYGVIGSSIGGVVGANLYSHFVDELNQPRTLWLIFTSIGVATIIGLLLYNKLVAQQNPSVKGEG